MSASTSIFTILTANAWHFFYPRVEAEGINRFDEYNDPPWPGCNKAVDEFLAGKPERLEMVSRDNYQKCYFVMK